MIIDSGTPCNRFQSKSQNLLGYDSVDPTTIREQAMVDVSAYGTVRWQQGSADQVKLDNSKIVVGVKDDEQDTKWVQGRKLIIATGVQDLLPDDIQGVDGCWGKTVIHCPYCHGYEFANKRTALLHMKPSVVLTMAPILKQFSNDLFVVGRLAGVDDPSSFSKEDLASFDNNGIKLINNNVISIRHTNGVLDTLILEDKTELPVDVAYLRPPFQHRFPLHEISALELNGKGYVAVDTETQKTSVPNIYACGDCTDPNRSLSIALASGTRAAKMLNYELSMDDWVQ